MARVTGRTGPASGACITPLVLAGLAHVAPCFAADEEAGAKPPAVEEVLVTAQRRSERSEKVPISVTAITPETLSNLDVRTIDQVAAITPDLVFDSGFSFAQIYIRGIGVSIGVGVGLESSVSTYLDGVYVPRMVGTIFNLVDVSSVQVLKGPQGTLYGRNSGGGAILINTADPTDKFSVSGTAQAGRFNHAQVDSVINLPVSDTLAVRVAARHLSDDGFVFNTTTDETLRGLRSDDVRAKVKWTPNENFTSLLQADYHFQSSRYPAVGRQDAVGSLSALCIGCLFGGSASVTDPYQVSSDYAPVDTGQSYAVRLNLQYTLNNLTFQNTVAYRDLSQAVSDDIDHTSAPLFATTARYSGKTVSDDFQISSSFGGVFDFLAGGQYIHDSANALNRLFGELVGLPYVGSYVPANTAMGYQVVVTKSYAGYGELYIRPIDRTTITLGGRYTKDTRSLESNWNENAVQDLSGNPAGPLTASQSASYNKFTPRAVIAYDFGPVNAYASYTQGFKAGGFNVPAFVPQTVPINPEKVDSYEIGAKFVSADRRTRANAAAFFYNYNDLQVSIIGQNASSQIIKNAATAQGKGIETDLSQKLTDWLTVGVGGSYLDAHYTRYPDAPVYGTVTGPTGQIVALALKTVDLSGTPLVRAPKWSGNLSFDVATPLGKEWLGHLDGVVHYTSRYLFTPGAGGDLHYDTQSPYALANLSGGIGPSSGSYEVGFYIDNLFNKIYYEQRNVGSTGPEALIAPPRTYGVRGAFNF
jgi:iron complex outermembrane recepter protein